jgi:uroporphyrinogen-III synthase
MGASTGILVTRRGVSNGFTVMSGREQGGAVSGVASDDRLRLPLVLFMAISAWPELKEQLLDAGVAADTAATTVMNAGSPFEQVLRATVATLGEAMAEAVAGIDGKPAGLIVVGEVARFGFSGEWGALQGRRVLLTCSEALQDEACREVLNAGGKPVALPLIRMQTEAAASKALAAVSDYDWLVITSPSAVRCLLQALRTGAGDIRRLPAIMACGPGTVRELRSAGLKPEAVPVRGFGGEGILRLAEARFGKGTSVLRVRSDQAGPTLAAKMRDLGADVNDLCLYRNKPVTPGALPPFDMVFFASSSAVNGFVGTWGTDPLEGRTVLAIGQPTARALDAAGVEDVLVSPEATVPDAIAHLSAACVNARLSGTLKE